MTTRKKQTLHPAITKTLAAALLFFVVIPTAWASGPAEDLQGFATPEAAVGALAAAIGSNDAAHLLAIFGKDGMALFSSGDPVADQQRREKFTQAYERKHALSREGAGMILIIGDQDWPFPIPMVQHGARWFFDTAAGKEEMLNRWIGENELDTIQTLLAIVDAQREYAMQDRDGDGLLEYAEKFAGDPGRRNGLYWETAPGEAPSPLGRLVAEAWSEGYRRTGEPSGPIPYHGYYFRILKAQGPHADGGPYDYMVNGHMIGGFGVLAYPATYGVSGVMSFQVNHAGVIYEKNLGPATAKIAPVIEAFDPDRTWQQH